MPDYFSRRIIIKKGRNLDLRKEIIVLNSIKKEAEFYQRCNAVFILNNDSQNNFETHP